MDLSMERIGRDGFGWWGRWGRWNGRLRWGGVGRLWVWIRFIALGALRIIFIIMGMLDGKST